jgi:ribosomal protein L16 Arg81 hydroxylase
MRAMNSNQPLDQLLAPVARTTFLSEYWDRRSLHIRGTADKLAALRFDRAALLSAIARAENPPEVKAQYITEEGVHAEFPLTCHDRYFLDQQFEAGLTICATDLGSRLPVVDDFARALARQFDLGGRLLTSCYLSPVGKGFGLHFDSNPVIVLQSEGSKRWLHGKTPAVRGPGHNVVASHVPELVDFVRERPWSRLRIPREQELEEATLHPGDVLYLPAGTWHRAYAEAPSIAWTFTLVQPSWFTLVSTLLQRRMSHDPAWRMFPPVGADSARGERWHERPEVRPFIAAQLAALQRAVAGLGVDDFAELLQRPPARSVDAAPPDTRDAPARLGPDEALEVGSRAQLALITSADDDGDVLRVYWGHEGIEVPTACEAVIERAFAARRFLARDVVDWFAASHRPTWAEVQALLESFLELGMLARADRRVAAALP